MAGPAVSFLGDLFITCMCGHIAWQGLPFTTLGAILAWAQFGSAPAGGSAAPYPVGTARASDNAPAPQPAGETAFGYVVRIGAVIPTTVMLLKNIADVLWNGHSPLFR